MQAQQKPTLQTLQIIWTALFISSGLFAFLLAQNPQISGEMTDLDARLSAIFADQPMVALFLAIAVANAFIGWWLPSKLIKARSIKWTAESPFSDRLAAYYSAAIIRFALLESCAILGFLAATVTEWIGVAAPFFAISAVGMIFAFPSSDRVLRATDRP
jgi:hypothetical protein